MRRRRPLLLLLASTLASLLGGCLTPPLLGGEKLDNPRDALDLHLIEYPERVRPRPVRLFDPASPPDGLFVDVPGGPLVVHFLPSGLSLLDEEATFERIATQLFDLGLGSLAFEYPGVGLSRAEKRPDELRSYAAAVIEKARELAPGRPIVVRGASLGSMVGASAATENEGPTAAVWIAPVRPSTIVARFSRCALTWIPGSLVAPWFRTPKVGDPEDAAGRMPTFVVASPGDPLLARRHLEELETRALANGGSRYHGPPDSHLITVRYTGCLAPGETAFYAELFGPIGLDVEGAVRARLTAEFGSEEADLDEFFATLGPEALEVAVDLLVLHDGRPERGRFDLLPRRPDGQPIPPGVWRDQLREVRGFAFLSPEETRKVLRFMLRDAPTRNLLGRDQKLAMTASGWPFDESLEVDLAGPYGDPADYFVRIAHLGGFEWNWTEKPDGIWLHIASSELVARLTPEQAEAREVGGNLGKVSARIRRIDRFLPTDSRRAVREVLEAGMTSLGDAPRTR